jgi:hypothetical protein
LALEVLPLLVLIAKVVREFLLLEKVPVEISLMLNAFPYRFKISKSTAMTST